VARIPIGRAGHLYALAKGCQHLMEDYMPEFVGKCGPKSIVSPCLLWQFSSNSDSGLHVGEEVSHSMKSPTLLLKIRIEIEAVRFLFNELCEIVGMDRITHLAAIPKEKAADYPFAFLVYLIPFVVRPTKKATGPISDPLHN
jgi:hypothetical protein